MVVIIGLGASWYLVSQLNTESGTGSAAVKARNAADPEHGEGGADRLRRSAGHQGRREPPGRPALPGGRRGFQRLAGQRRHGVVSLHACRSSAAFPGARSASTSSSMPSGEPLWYVVAPGWAGAGTVINSDCASPTSGMACATGRLTVDGVGERRHRAHHRAGPALQRVRLGELHGVEPGPVDHGTAGLRAIISNARTPPGPPTRPSPRPAPAVRSTTRWSPSRWPTSCRRSRPRSPSASSARSCRALRHVYAPAAWGFCGDERRLSVCGAVRAIPGPAPARRTIGGVAATYAGLLPFNQTDCTAAAGNPRCLPASALTAGRSARGRRTMPGGWRLHPDPVVLVGNRQLRPRLHGRVPRRRQRHRPIPGSHRAADDATKCRHGLAPLRSDAGCTIAARDDVGATAWHPADGELTSARANGRFADHHRSGPTHARTSTAHGLGHLRELPHPDRARGVRRPRAARYGRRDHRLVRAQRMVPA